MNAIPAAPLLFGVPSTAGSVLSVYRWGDPASARAAIQVTHGMGEHALRYVHLAQTLVAEGYVVYAQDHLGHGANVSELVELGQIGENGWQCLVDDLGGITAFINTDAPGLPVAVVAHSMGSFALQQYALDHSEKLAAAVFTGTSSLDLLEPALDLDQELDLAMFNAPFAPARTDFDWLSRDDAQVDAYIADPKCGFGLDVPAAKAMFVGARRMADTDQVAQMRKDLPVYVAVGSEDPVNGELALVNALVGRYQAAGIRSISLQIYDGARHEIFNETNRTEVEGDLVAWLATALT